jgi:outer membrane lipoprotein carrier protein
MKKTCRIAGRIIGAFFFILFLFVSVLGIRGWTQEKGDLGFILVQLRERFASAKTFQADYIRQLVPKIESKLPAASLQAEGMLYFRSPDNLRLDQKKPRKEQLICNGEKVWWYLSEDKLVYVYQLKEYYFQIKPIIDFLSGLGGLDKNFSVKLDTTVPEEAPFYQLRLLPKNPQPDLQQIVVRISRKTFLPLDFTFYNILGDGTRFRFNQVQPGVSLPRQWFEFTPPKGTVVVPQSLSPPPRK